MFVVTGYQRTFLAYCNRSDFALGLDPGAFQHVDKTQRCRTKTRARVILSRLCWLRRTCRLALPHVDPSLWLQCVRAIQRGRIGVAAINERVDGAQCVVTGSQPGAVGSLAVGHGQGSGRPPFRASGRSNQRLVCTLAYGEANSKLLSTAIDEKLAGSR